MHPQTKAMYSTWLVHKCMVHVCILSIHIANSLILLMAEIALMISRVVFFISHDFLMFLSPFAPDVFA